MRHIAQRTHHTTKTLQKEPFKIREASDDSSVMDEIHNSITQVLKEFTFTTVNSLT